MSDSERFRGDGWQNRDGRHELLAALCSPPHGNLRGETEPAHQPGSPRDAAGDVELPADQRGHPHAGPDLVLVPAVRGQPLLEVAGQLLLALHRQSVGATAKSDCR